MRTTLLRFNQAIFIKNMENALLCPIQAREQGTIVDDVPSYLDHTGASTFTVIAGDVQLPLNQNGPTAYPQLQRPTKQELADLYDEVIDITNEHEWNSYKTPHPTTYDVASLSHKINSDIDDWLLYRHNRAISALKVAKPKNKLTAEYLAQIWKCGLETAQKTIEASTCAHYRHISDGITKRFRPARDFMRFRMLRLPAGEFYSDTMMSKVRSVRRYSCAQIYGNKFGYIKAYPMEQHNKQYVGNTLTMMIQDTGVMQKLHTDNAPEMTGRKNPFFVRARKEGIYLTSIEPLRPDEIYGEILVKKAKQLSNKLMVRRNVPLRLWCYALKYACELSSIMVPNMYRNRGRSGYEMIFGNTPDM